MRLRVEEGLWPANVNFKLDPPHSSLTVIAKSAYQLSPGKPAELITDFDLQYVCCPEVFTEDDPTKSVIYPSDMSVYKPHCDLLLVGNAYAPEQKPVREFPIRFSVGGWTKTLNVVGPRTWKGAFQYPSEPEEFTSVPVTYENAFGGPDFQWNPVGTGKAGDPPQIEYPNQPVLDAKDRHQPASFGPVHFQWAPRNQNLGTMDQTYMNTRWPWFAEDMDLSIHNSAPKDQQVAFLRGDEPIELLNLHPDHPVYRTQLPGVKLRGFFDEIDSDQKRERIRETGFNLDTLWIDMEKELMILVWRSVTKVRQFRCHDIEKFLVVREPLAEPVESQEYINTFDERVKKIEMSLPPEMEAMLAEAKESIRDAQAKFEEEVKPQLDAELDKAAEKSGPEQAEMLGSVKDLFNEFLTLQGSSLNDSHEELMAKQQKLEKKMEAIASKSDEDTPTLEDIRADFRTQREYLINAGFDEDDDVVRNFDTKIDDFEQMLIDNPDMEKSFPITAAMLQQMMANGDSLEGRFVLKQSLGHLDFRNHSLAGMFLIDCKIPQGRFQESDFTNVTLIRCDLTDADFSDAKLADVSIVQCTVSGIKLNNCDVNNIRLIDMDLSNVEMNNTVGQSPTFVKCKMMQGKFQGSDWARTNFLECDLSDADFSNSVMLTTTFARIKAVGARFTRCDLSQSGSPIFSDFSMASFRRAILDRTYWQEVDFRGCDFSGCRMEMGCMALANCQKATFHRADMPLSKLSDTDLTQVVFTEANLLRTEWERSVIKKTDFRGSNLFQAFFWENEVEEADFRHTNQKRSMWKSNIGHKNN